MDAVSSTGDKQKPAVRRVDAVGRPTAVMDRRPLAYFWVVGGAIVTTVILLSLRHWLDFGRASLLYLPLVIACAVRFGFGPAMVASVLSFCLGDYFLVKPYYTLWVNSPDDWTSLIVFVVTAVSTASLAARARNSAHDAQSRERETAMLYQASYAVSREVELARLLPTLIEQVMNLCESTDCVVFRNDPRGDGLTISASGSRTAGTIASDEPLFDTARVVLLQDQGLGFGCTRETWLDECKTLKVNLPESAAKAPGLYIPLHVHGYRVGVFFLAYRADGLAYTHREERIILALANQAAVVVARSLIAEQSEEQARETAILEERNRLARDVHDTLSHAFTGIKFLLEAAERMGPTPKAIECVTEARQLAVAGAQEARQSVMALRAASLEKAGYLSTAIQNIARSLPQKAAIDVDVSVEGSATPLAPATEENLFRICQESLTNVIRHADASCAHIVLAYSDQVVTLSIEDDGCGFDPDIIDTSACFGLTSMRQRCAGIGAEFTITSKQGNGTKITVKVKSE